MREKRIHNGSSVRIETSVTRHGILTMNIMYGNAHDRRCTFFQNRFQIFIEQASFFHFALCLFPKIVFCAMQNIKGKLKFRKIENIKLWHGLRGSKTKSSELQ